jgi:hypothetical protein
MHETSELETTADCDQREAEAVSPAYGLLRNEYSRMDVAKAILLDSGGRPVSAQVF